MHAKRFIVLAHLLFLALSIWLMWNVGAVEFAGLSVPGLDRLLPFDVPAREALREGDNDSLLNRGAIRYDPTPEDYSITVMRAIDGVWQRDGVSPLFCVNSALFRLPFLSVSSR
ncbi:unnamed protein product [Cylicocyclus nassatus]|uniref:Uncharacterized protein n=1 Tax=Cylicocyclus nassatus TaxID=53992 RepID=A0AA36MEV8_CYLNA|nr:unnamed protein product [Cylicocyclus nassatus]